uniref:uncharacterized protein LOC122585953 n=1 Tax=Erigeron canadensis TaxID=72917 RepID=UPI001CB9019D|nr:uncharacterized protein LOC122585953 [Erigeron canadensis]XP_043614004.1 uncharacterized protein LOC122585953 [Erigeron canadensis]XP_043614005.1 uncharacterized protein LOC122585953 [Erigeron canadensis]
MREDHYEIQTLKKDQFPVSSNRKSKQSNSSKKHQQKNVKKSLNSVFTPITENDILLDLSDKESTNRISSVSEAVDTDPSIVDICKTSLDFDQNQVFEEPEKVAPESYSFVFEDDQPSMESYIVSLNEFISPSTTTASSVEGTPLSCITTGEKTPQSSPITDEADVVFVDSVIHSGTTTEETSSIKLESLVKHLRLSMFQVLHSAEIDPPYKKLLDILVKTVSEEFCSLHDEEDKVVKLFPKKVTIVLLCFVLGMLAIPAGFFLFSDGQSSYHGPPPT